MQLQLLALSGSLRAASMNTALLRCAVGVCPAGVTLSVYDELAQLPHFNPDTETSPPPVVARWHSLLRQCDGVLIACPEYAHGLPGSFKNALDWAVGLPGLEGKPVALLNTSPRARHAHAALTEIVTTIGWRVVGSASVRIACARKDVDAQTLCDVAEFAQPLRAALLDLSDAARRHVGVRFPAS